MQENLLETKRLNLDLPPANSTQTHWYFSEECDKWRLVFISTNLHIVISNLEKILEEISYTCGVEVGM